MSFSAFKRMTCAAMFTAIATCAQAGVVVVPYSGNYDERVSAPNGDYDAIGGLDDVGQFKLLAGNNVFLGDVKTPGDSSDFFQISVGAGLKLVGAAIVWGTNANDFNPIFASPGPLWTLEESTVTPTIFLIPDLGGNRSTTALNYVANAFARGPGDYGMTLGNGTFAMNNNDAIAYRMTFVVESTDVTNPNPVSEPGTFALVGLALAALGLMSKRRRTA
jgi:PEP-CTERM motif